jgi:hypothetical protein
MKLLTFNNAKTTKGDSLGWRTAIMYLAPSNSSGIANTCRWATHDCRALCLYNSGYASVYPSVNKARIERTKFMVKHTAEFIEQLCKEIEAHIRFCKKNKMKPCVRLNGTSDIYEQWHFDSVIQNFPEIQFYDYSKSIDRVLMWLNGYGPKNYHLTYSHAEGRLDESFTVLEKGGNVSVVFDTPRNKRLPKLWNGYTVLDGDKHDLRFLNPDMRYKLDKRAGLVIGLRAKGKARKKEAIPNTFINPTRNTK